MRAMASCDSSALVCRILNSSSIKFVHNSPRVTCAANLAVPPTAGRAKCAQNLARLLPEVAKRALIQPLLDAFVQITHSRSPQLNQSLDRKSTRLNSSHLGISYA